MTIRTTLMLIGMTLLGLAFAASPQVALAQSFGPDTCVQGFVWREACGRGDHVCVTPDIRTQAQLDNAQANARRQPGGGAFGPETCRQGFVWRDACVPFDHVCVPVSTRTQAADDNRHAAERRQRPQLVVKVCQWRGDAPFCNGDCPDGWSKEWNASDDFHSKNVPAPGAGNFGQSCLTGTKALCCRLQ
jgi:hypothetical protein